MYGRCWRRINSLTTQPIPNSRFDETRIYSPSYRNSFTVILGILAVFLVILVIASLLGRGQVSWAARMIRLHPGSRKKAEWMAPEIVVQSVHRDYLDAMRWLPDSSLLDYVQQWNQAPSYLTGESLRRHQEILRHYLAGKPSQFVGILRCLHHVQVRRFSPDGERCIVLDHQTSRRMATYDNHNDIRVGTQDMGDATLVYEMQFDRSDGRWKINRYIQTMPAGWITENASKKVELWQKLPASTGRDN